MLGLVLVFVLPLGQVDHVAPVGTEGQGEEDGVEDDVPVHLLRLDADLAVDGGVGDVQDEADPLLYPDLGVAAGPGAGGPLDELALGPELPPHLCAVVLRGVDGVSVVNVDDTMGTFVQARVLAETDSLQHLVDLPHFVIELLHELLHTRRVDTLMMTAKSASHSEHEEADQEGLGDEEVHPTSRLQSLSP